MSPGLLRYSFPEIFRILLISVKLCVSHFLFWPLRRLRLRRMYNRPPAPTDDILIYSQVVWQEVWQRPQEMSLHLSRRRPVIFISPIQVHRLFDSVRTWQWHLHDETHGNVDVYQPLILPGEYKSRLIRLLNRFIVTDTLRLIMAARGAPSVFITNSPFSGFIMSAFEWRMKIYDIIDDFIHCSWAPPASDLKELEQIKHCDMIFTGTRQLYETKQALHDNIHFIPLGVDFDLFHFEQPPDEPKDLAPIRKPRLGYIGSISDRLDPAILDGLARQYPEASLVLIGPVHGSFEPPANAPNIHFLGPRPHDKIGRYLAHFDLALIPFRQNIMTQSLNPIKTLEYLAAGKVVISTALPDIERFYGDLVVTAQSAGDFIDKVGKWLNQDRAEMEKRATERARGHSWQAMADTMWEKIQQTPGKETR